jgi:hypothetical protein
MALTYRGMLVEDLQSVDSIEGHRRRLFGTYVQRMFRRRGIEKRYSLEQTTHWLAWLAHKMSQHAQATFLIERMQPTWLPTSARLYYTITLGLVLMTMGTLSVLFTEIDLLGSLLAGASIGLIGALTAGFISPTEVLVWSWKESAKLLLQAVWGVIWTAGRFLVPVMAVYGLIMGDGSGETPLLFGGTINARIDGLLSGALAGLVFALVLGLIGVPIFALMLIWMGSTELEIRTRPNQGMWQSAKNSIAMAPVGGVITAVLFWLSGGGNRLVADGLPGLLFGGLATGLILGGNAVIKHFLLRCPFYCAGHIPWNYARFLDCAAERIFLRKVGGGYIFIHRLLQDYFASLYQDQ